MTTLSKSVLRLVARIEKFCSEPIPETGPELASDLIELARGRNLLDLKFSEMAAALRPR